MKISEKIRRLRAEVDLTQEQFGKIAGVSGKAVSTWESGEKEPRMKALQMLCAHYNINLNEFADTDSDCYSAETSENKLPEKKNIVRIAGRDGRYLEREMSDQQIDLLLAMVDQMPKPDDL